MTMYDDMRGYVHNRNGWSYVETETTPVYQMVNKAEAENAKLRELCRDMWDWTLHGCSACSLIDVNECLTDIYSEYCLMREMLTNRVRELGVEATNGE